MSDYRQERKMAKSKVYLQVDRVDASTCAQALKASVADLHESMGATLARTSTMGAQMRPLLEGVRVAGPAVTAFCPPGDNLMMHRALYLAQKGDVLVVQAPESGAQWGDMAAYYAGLKGLAGTVVDGFIRDTDDLRAMGSPVWATKIGPSTPQKCGHGLVNAPIVCCGVRVAPGDLIVADGDGVIAIPKREAAAVVARALERAGRERAHRADIEAGKHPWHLHGSPTTTRRWTSRRSTALGAPDPPLSKERNSMKRALALASVLAALAIAAAPAAIAQDYPARPVKLVVPQAPGGATDVFARYIGQKLGAKWGQPVIVENKAGAAGVVGTDVVARAPADGYTMLVTYAGSQAVNQSLYAKLPFDSVKDFQTVATISRTAFFLVVAADSPVRTFPDLIARARAKPGSVTYATSGSGSINHLLSESLKVEAGIDMVHVPYMAISAAMADVIGGKVDNAFAAVPSALQLVRGGRLRALAVSSSKRNSGAPEVPTIAELGYPTFDVHPWWGILAPAGTPRAIVDKVNADVAEILGTPEVQAFFKDQGSEPLIMSPDDFMKLLQDDVQKWAKVVKSSGARLD